MDERIDELHLVIEVYDDQGNFEGEWAYEVSRESIEDWERADQCNSREGKTLVRYLLLSRLAEYSPITWQLLKNNVCVGEFAAAGVPSNIVKEIPRLNTVNIAVDRMYECLSELVISENIRIVH
jgi:hypothetical protein